MIDPDADAEERLRVEGELETGLGVSVRAAARAIPAASPLSALTVEADLHDLLVVGVSGLGEERLQEAVERLQPVDHCSLILVRAHPEAPRETGRKE